MFHDCVPAESSRTYNACRRCCAIAVGHRAARGTIVWLRIDNVMWGEGIDGRFYFAYLCFTT